MRHFNLLSLSLCMRFTCTHESSARYNSGKQTCAIEAIKNNSDSIRRRGYRRGIICIEIRNTHLYHRTKNRKKRPQYPSVPITFSLPVPEIKGAFQRGQASSLSPRILEPIPLNPVSNELWDPKLGVPTNRNWVISRGAHTNTLKQSTIRQAWRLRNLAEWASELLRSDSSICQSTNATLRVSSCVPGFRERLTQRERAADKYY